MIRGGVLQYVSNAVAVAAAEIAEGRRVTMQPAMPRRDSVTPTIAAALAATLGLFACAKPTPSPAPETQVRIATGLPGMTFKPLGEALVTAYAEVMPDVKFSVVETEGSVSNLARLEGGTAELGLALADVAYMAYNGAAFLNSRRAQNAFVASPCSTRRLCMPSSPRDPMSEPFRTFASGELASERPAVVPL